MRLLHPFGLVDSPIDLVVFPFKCGFVLRPHRQNDLDCFVQTLQAFACSRIGIAICAVFVLEPARTDTKIEAAMAEYIHGAGYFCQERGIAIAITCHHLTNANAFRIASEGGGACPTFKGHLLRGGGNGMEMIVEPDRVKAQCFGFLCDAGHCFICLNRIGNAHQVHAPALRHNYSIIHRHVQYSFPVYSASKLLGRSIYHSWNSMQRPSSSKRSTKILFHSVLNVEPSASK